MLNMSDKFPNNQTTLSKKINKVVKKAKSFQNKNKQTSYKKKQSNKLSNSRNSYKKIFKTIKGRTSFQTVEKVFKNIRKRSQKHRNFVEKLKTF